ncbi:hypothetical protein GPOL_c12700 [Gordonia polyisoprenivorans VH2]|uniref:Holin n=1 Tax=Gordonia polyisoprenivorans (strain DSM 44266 / VH2) TaxID=1112204 RepID=H6N3G6_GORPV|nr:hypothetical protein [Gordonia polyisoprenivorans]AFA72325.1 hypothetical protein GPOL_c12700 [Gordonia polyisoprenivorans VH2]
MATVKIAASQATWGDKVSQYSKAIVTGVGFASATVTDIVSAVGTHIPATELAWINGAIGAATLIATYLSRNTEILKELADDTEEVVHQIDPKP